MEFEYDSWGRACAITYPDGERVSYAYDCGGSLLSMRGAKGSTARNYIDKVSYNIYGQRSRIEYGNGTRAEYRYDDLRRLSRLKTYAVQGGSRVAVQDIVYRFDSVGNIVLDSNSAAACGGIGGQYVNRYRYDAISRLVGATQSNTYSSGNVLSAAYSPSGQLCSKQQTFTGQNSAFGYDGSDKPHAPRRLFDSGLHRLHDLQWDAMGNLAQVNSYLTDAESEADYEGSRHLFWTEDNRMVNAVDDKYFSYYAYDHSGERVLKMTGKNTLLDINADRVHTSSYVDKITLYTSPYLVADDNGYTKHYYAGTERVCAVIGNGGFNNLCNFINVDPHMQNTANSLYEKCISVMQDRQLQQNNGDVIEACGQAADGFDIDLKLVPASVLQESAVKTTTFENAMNANSQLSQQGEIAYFYHGDHLGSASWITDANGIPVQHLQYLPFGEPFIDQRTSSYSERFTFTGKEKDSETGFYYFGARYYDPSISGLFLSVDPMSDKYPSISPYAYCAWNPVKLVDPEGREFGDIYNLRGQHIGSDGRNDNVVYLKSTWSNRQLSTVESNLLIMFGGVKNITEETGLTNDELNLRATLSTIKQAEAGHKNPPLDYNSWNGSDHFTEDSYVDNPKAYAKHPGTNPNTKRSASGAYQFLKKFWDSDDFSPQAQDKAAVNLMTKSGYEAALNGDMAGFINSSSKRWTSLSQWEVSDLQDVFCYNRAKELIGKTNIATPIGSLLKKK
jgi:RHS repeat-associated protein